MISLIFALPVIVADISSRKIPNIYLIFYSYLAISVLVSYGFANLIIIGLLAGTLIFFSQLGLGMGDIKLIILVAVLVQISSVTLLSYFLAAIVVAATLNILLIYVISKVFPVSIAMAPAIFIGTGLYLATHNG